MQVIDTEGKLEAPVNRQSESKRSEVDTVAVVRTCVCWSNLRSRRYGGVARVGLDRFRQDMDLPDREDIAHMGLCRYRSTGTVR